jgi:hypothetical protein
MNPEQSTLSGFSRFDASARGALVIRAARGVGGMGMPPDLGLCYVHQYESFPSRTEQNSSFQRRYGWIAHQARRSNVAELKTKVFRS